MWGAYFRMGAYKRDVVVVIKMGAYIHGVLILCGYLLSRFYGIIITRVRILGCNDWYTFLFLFCSLPVILSLPVQHLLLLSLPVQDQTAICCSLKSSIKVYCFFLSAYQYV